MAGERATRRAVLFGAGSLLVGGCAPGAAPTVPEPLVPLLEVERNLGGGRIGVAAIDAGSGVRLGYRAAERFAMCSTFKAPLVALVLAKVDGGALTPEQLLPFTTADILEHAPVAKAHLERGAMTVEAACAAAVEVSDNTAANLLLREVGGPPGLTAFLRSIGDSVTRLDRDEPTLNANVPGDPRDTTTPAAMSETMRALLLDDVLRPPSRRRLLGWLQSSETGKNRLRAGLPPGWQGGDKTGTGENGAVNDVAIVWSSGRAPIVIASYVHAPEAKAEVAAAAHADVAGFVIRALGSGRRR